MTVTCSGCPRCGSREVVPCDVIEEGYEEKVRANLECANPKCGQRFRYVPPEPRKEAP